MQDTTDAGDTKCIDLASLAYNVTTSLYSGDNNYSITQYLDLVTIE